MKLRITVEGKQYDVNVQVLDAQGGEASEPVASIADQSATSKAAEQPVSAGAASGAPVDVTAPVAGSVFDVKVAVGDQVQEHDTLLVLEAMKMESNIPAPQAGAVREVLVSPGDSVTAGQPLVRLG